MGKILFVAFALFIIAACAPRDMQSASVRVIVGPGHGSGTVIARNVVLTAAHVVDNQASIEIETEDGRKFPARVLWSSRAYDVAALTYDGAALPMAEISCGTLLPDTPIVAYGSPGPIRFARFHGRIATKGGERGPWAHAHVMDLTAWMGMSGGGIFDNRGRLVGVTVGIYSAGSMFGPPPPSGMATMVPSSSICKMMGR